MFVLRIWITYVFFYVVIESSFFVYFYIEFIFCEISRDLFLVVIVVRSLVI